MTCGCRGLTSRLHQLGGQSFVHQRHGHERANQLQPTVFVDTIPELAVERRRHVDLGALRSSCRESRASSPAPNPKRLGE